MNLSYGSQGEEVRKLQEALNSQGYGLSVDGIYGAKTQAAVRDYQSKNGLSVDGIAGVNTQGKLYSTQTAGTTAQPATAKPVTPAYETPKPSAYQPSETVEAYKQQLQQQIKNKPRQYQNPYQQQLDDLYQQITGRQPFSYDAEGDALYQKYKEQYQALGKQAMADTMGQAAALTGGYGSTYGQSVGQQQYDAYLRQLTDKIPELQQAAYGRYTQEGQDLLDRYGLLQTREADAYGKYRDEVSDWSDEVSRLYSLYSGERDYEYGAAMDERDYGYQLASENRKYAYDTAMGMISAGVMPGDQMLADAGLSKADAQAMVNAYLAQMAAAASGGGGSGGRGSGGGRRSGGGSGENTTGQTGNAGAYGAAAQMVGKATTLAKRMAILNRYKESLTSQEYNDIYDQLIRPYDKGKGSGGSGAFVTNKNNLAGR